MLLHEMHLQVLIMGHVAVMFNSVLQIGMIGKLISLYLIYYVVSYYNNIVQHIIQKNKRREKHHTGLSMVMPASYSRRMSID